MSRPRRHMKRSLHFLLVHRKDKPPTQIHYYYNNNITSAEVSCLSALLLRFQKETHHIGGAGGSSFQQQVLHNVEMTHKRCHMQGGQARLFRRGGRILQMVSHANHIKIKMICELFPHLSHSLYWCRVFKQEIHHTIVVLFTSNMQRSKAIL